MRNRILPLLGALLAGALTAGFAMGGRTDGGQYEGGNGVEPYAVGLWGDLPYNAVQATTGVPNLIADMNEQKLAFTAMDGDLKAGSGPCTQALYDQARGSSIR